MVTGANVGIGKAVTAELARSGATLVMVCRDQSKGEAARTEIKTATGNQSIDLMIADLSLLAAVRQLARNFKDKYPRLDVLINNAAIFKFSRTTTVDGLETTWLG
jgi:NAD(P)-dependent dehydrogenase (short-subunit alcohol dehydrogenase family)